MYLKGEAIDLKEIDKFVNQRVKYLLKKDINEHHATPSTGVITDVHNKNVEFDGREFIHINDIIELTLEKL